MKRWIPVWLLLSLLLCACGTVSPAPAEESSTPSVHEAPVPEVTKAPTPVPVVIRDALYESGSYSDNVGNSWDYLLRIPMIDETRSLYLSNSAAIAAYEVLRQWDYPELQNKGELHRHRWSDLNNLS